MITLDVRKPVIWESMSDELRLETLVYYMKNYDVDKTYDNYVLLALATNGFLDIIYNHHSSDKSVLRYVNKEKISLANDVDDIWNEKFSNGISIVHTVPDGHMLCPYVEYTQSHFVNNYTYSSELFESKFNSDFMLSYLLLLIGEEQLKKNYRRIILDTYEPESNNALWDKPKTEWDGLNFDLEPIAPSSSSTSEKHYGTWETFVVNFLNIKQGNVLDVYPGIGTLAMYIDLLNVSYVAHTLISNLEENGLINLFFCFDTYFSNHYTHEQIRVIYDTIPGVQAKGVLFDFVIFNIYNHRNYVPHWKLHSSYIREKIFERVESLMSPKGKALITLRNDQYCCANKELYQTLIDTIILLSPSKSIVLLDKQKDCTDTIKVYDRIGWSEFTAEQLLDSIRNQEGLQVLTLEDIESMGGYLNIDALKRNQNRIKVPVGYKLVRINEVARNITLKEDAWGDSRLLYRNIEGYTPLSPYVSASKGNYAPEYEDSNYCLINQKMVVIYHLAKEYYKTYIFDPSDGEAGVDSDCICLSIDEEKVNIDYLIYQMNEEYFVKQLYPHEEGNCNPIKAKDILSCQILVPDVNTSLERQKQFIEDLRQKAIAEFAQRYGYDLGKFVQYKDTDLPIGTKLYHGKYTILQALSQGGFGKVYKARNEETGEVVAIKEFFYQGLQVRDPQTYEVKSNFVNIEDFEFAKSKFLNERKRIQEFDHDNIIKVYEDFDDKNTCYYSMEYINGKNLYGYRKAKQHIGEKEALAIVRQIADALKLIHSKKYNHSDVKPQNILLDNDGIATLIDFGAAHQYKNMDALSLQNNSVPLYVESEGYTPKNASLSPDFHAGRDIYSLGATLYYIVTGESPKNLDRSKRHEKISPKIWYAICKAMEENPRKWLKSVDDLLKYLPSDDELNDIQEQETGERLRITPRSITSLNEDEVFVFGSNIRGYHSGGAAKFALNWGAKWNVAFGCMGQTYAIPTVGVNDVEAISGYVEQFIEYAEANEHKTFLVTAVGCGSAGFTPQEIAPLFAECVEMSNVYLPESFLRELKRQGYIS